MNMSPQKLILLVIVSAFTFYFLFFARSIEESLEQCVACKTYFETPGPMLFLGLVTCGCE